MERGKRRRREVGSRRKWGEEIRKQKKEWKKGKWGKRDERKNVRKGIKRRKRKGDLMERGGGEEGYG